MAGKHVFALLIHPIRRGGHPFSFGSKDAMSKIPQTNVGGVFNDLTVAKAAVKELRDDGFDKDKVAERRGTGTRR